MTKVPKVCPICGKPVDSMADRSEAFPTVVRVYLPCGCEVTL